MTNPERDASPSPSLAGKRVRVFSRDDNERARDWAPRVSLWVAERGGEVVSGDASADVVVALGGDGTILEAARRYGRDGAVVVGLNLGTVGFLASAREPDEFVVALDRFARGDFRPVARVMVESQVLRDGQVVFAADSLNDVSVQHLLGVVELEVSIDGHLVQSIRGNGVLVSTATGSTAYNLSAHGPIVAPDIQCLVITELLDHSLPTPPVVIPPRHVVEVKVVAFREHPLLGAADGRDAINVLLSADGGQTFSLRAGDVVRVTGSPNLVTFAELEPNHFFRSLREQFKFR